MRAVAKARHVAGAALWAVRNPPAGDAASAPSDSPEPVRGATPSEPDWLQRDRSDGENMRRLVTWCSAGDAALDVGAHHGALLDEMLRVAPSGRHIALEPLPHLAAHLRETFPGVTVHEVAASNPTGTTTFAHVRGAEGWSGLKYRPLPGSTSTRTSTRSPCSCGRSTSWLTTLIPESSSSTWRAPSSRSSRGRCARSASTVRSSSSSMAAGRPSTSTPAGRHPSPADREAGLRIFDLDGNGPYPLADFQRSFHAAERVNFVAKP